MAWSQQQLSILPAPKSTVWDGLGGPWLPHGQGQGKLLWP